MGISKVNFLLETWTWWVVIWILQRSYPAQHILTYTYPFHPHLTYTHLLVNVYNSFSIAQCTSSLSWSVWQVASSVDRLHVVYPGFEFAVFKTLVFKQPVFKAAAFKPPVFGLPAILKFPDSRSRPLRRQRWRWRWRCWLLPARNQS